VCLLYKDHPSNVLQICRAGCHFFYSAARGKRDIPNRGAGEDMSSKGGRKLRVFEINLSVGFILLSIALSATVAFSVGVVLNAYAIGARTPGPESDRDFFEAPDAPLDVRGTSLPTSSIVTTKVVYKTKSSGDEPDASSERNYFSCAIHSAEEDGDDDSEDDESSSDDSEDGEEREEKLSNSSGQQLFLEMDGASPDFLASKESLMKAMYKIASAAQPSVDTSVTTQCYSYEGGKVYCGGFIQDSQFAIHTAPGSGKMTFDIFTCGKSDLIDLVPTVKELLVLNHLSGDDVKPRIRWSHWLRGFRHEDDAQIDPHLVPLEQDLGDDVSGLSDVKEIVVSRTTSFQRVDIISMLNRESHQIGAEEKYYQRYLKSLSRDGSYESLHPEFFQPDRILYLDGVLQSTLYGDAPYHESLVHPAMIAHPNPKRVAIIGGGEGATLREVLKHKTVEKVVMVEIDGELVELCTEYLPQWNRCDDIQGSTEICFDDPRAQVDFRDAFAWFIDSFGDKDNLKDEQFDVIIMDALDPDRFVDIVGSLYKNDLFVQSLFNGLKDDGVFVVQLGETDYVDDPPYQSMAPDTALMLDTIKSAGFDSMVNYENPHCFFGAPWTFMVSFKNYNTRSRWYRSSAEIEIDLHSRILSTKSGKPPLRYIDGSSMAEQQTPRPALERVYCRKSKLPWECQYDWFGVDLSSRAIHIAPATWNLMQSNKSGSGMAELLDLAKSTNFIPLGDQYMILGTGEDTPLSDNMADGKVPVYSPIFERHLRSLIVSKS